MGSKFIDTNQIGSSGTGAFADGYFQNIHSDNIAASSITSTSLHECGDKNREGRRHQGVQGAEVSRPEA